MDSVSKLLHHIGGQKCAGMSLLAFPGVLTRVFSEATPSYLWQ